jgi:hypothetical protein
MWNKKEYKIQCVWFVIFYTFVYLLLGSLQTEPQTSNCNSSSVVIIGLENTRVTRMTYLHFLFFFPPTKYPGRQLTVFKTYVMQPSIFCHAMLQCFSQKRSYHITRICKASQRTNAWQQTIVFALNCRKNHPLFGANPRVFIFMNKHTTKSKQLNLKSK